MTQESNHSAADNTAAGGPENGSLEAAGPTQASSPSPPWSVSNALSGATVMVTGTTGFLGKVFLSMLLRYHPDVDHVYVLIRPREAMTAAERFFEQIAANSVMDPLRDIYEDGYLAFLDEKCTPLDGDITDDHLGLDADQAADISAEIDVFVNSAGLTNFNPNLESALTINTLSQFNMLDFIRLADDPAAYMHVSTCFVAGNVDGKVHERLPGPKRYPNFDDLGVDYDAGREIEDCQAMIAHAKQLAADQEHQSQFAKQARQRLADQNIDPDNTAVFDQTVADIRSRWLRKRLSREGRERADFWGWPNIYTYTKSLGERVIAQAADEIELSIFRPAIIESALTYPGVGWNEGINTSAPLVFLMSKGHRYVPTRQGVDLDVIPVDYVAGSMLAVTAALLDGGNQPVYQCGTSQTNPISVKRLVELTNLGLRKANRSRQMPRWQQALLNSLDSVPVSADTYERRSAPGLNRAASGLRGLLDKVPTRQMGGLGDAVNRVKKGLKTAETLTGVTEKIFGLMLPFTHDNAFHFQTDHLQELADRLPAAEQARYGSPVDQLDWHHYWLDVHVPGLIRHAFPELNAKFEAGNDRSYTYDDLVELFDASTRNFANRVALQHHGDGIVERHTYAALKDQAERAAHALAGRGIAANAAVVIASENRPEWGMTYFGILKAGGVAVPVDPESSAHELTNMITSCAAQAVVVSDAVAARVGEELTNRLADADQTTLVLHFDELFEPAIGADAGADGDTPGSAVGALAADGGQPVAGPPAALVEAANDDQALASLIYTSGTTGQPKGVMLTHQNFTHLLASLQDTFAIDERDGFLSVLPLHHTFEFACGFLMPLSQGATITYMDELSAEALTSAMSSTRVSAMIGVPALWQLLHRRIRQRISDAPAALRWALDLIQSVNTTLRDRFNVNIGPSVFRAIHRAFGGQLDYLISGGAALPDDILEAFHGLGFNLYEGYGLTEAAPVLTVNTPHDGLNPGSVGKALPGVDLDIADPNGEGVGEVIARGDNVMRGYMDRDDDTNRALRDGWLYTGDLGKLDAKGRLTIVGRAKEVIVTAGGKNVYPDELEEIYAASPDIAELSVVGVPDGSGSQRVACLVRPVVSPSDDPAEADAARTRIREHIRVEGSRIAGHKRISVLRFWDDDLPRTATRKVKRTAVIDILKDLATRRRPPTDVDASDDGQWAWLYQRIADLAGVDATDIHADTHFADELGFDSLMVAELASILGQRDYQVTTDQLSSIRVVRHLQDLLDDPDSAAASTAMVSVDQQPTHETVEKADIPRPVARAGKTLLHMGQKKVYDTYFDVDVYGRANIPWHNPNVIVAANHASHLDMGLVKYGLGEFGRDIRALAAADYFFSNSTRKTYFDNFTNLIPVARSGSLHDSLANAEAAIDRGEMLLVFPEGTRSTDGTLQSFRRGLGYLAATKGVDVIPMYLDGTHRALPKGQSIPSITNRNLTVRIGGVLRADDALAATEDMSAMDRYDYISQQARQAIVDLQQAAHPPGSGDDQNMEDLFGGLSHTFQSNTLTEQLSFYVSLGNHHSLKWTIVADPDDCHIQQGKPDGGRADCVIKTSPDIFDRIVNDSYVPSMDEFMSGDIKTNDPQLLRQFQAVFNL